MRVTKITGTPSRSLSAKALSSTFRFFPGKGSGHSYFLSVVIISESVADIMDGFLFPDSAAHLLLSHRLPKSVPAPTQAVPDD